VVRPALSSGVETIPIARDSFCGTSSYGDGEFQGVCVCLTLDVVAKIAVGVTYTLRPKNTDLTHFWTVMPGVVLNTDPNQQPR
jgi:hypothetical protein